MTKETVLRIEAVINEFIKEQKASKDLDMKSNECPMDYKKMSGKNTRKKTFWYNINKNPTDDIMHDTVYNALVEEHPDEITKIECAKGGWSKYWTEVLQSMNAVINVFGKAFIRDFPTTQNIKWTNDHLWSEVDLNYNDSYDTYINRIIKDVLKINERTANNCVFVIAIIDLMFDSNIKTVTLSGELIFRRITDRAKKQEIALTTSQKKSITQEKENEFIELDGTYDDNEDMISSSDDNDE
ncbi:17340_t:CDS:2 [Funneliformis caledonium]|uniref:17340_t:CDS:1 n=1 Tax=Funneliformis caledonium TaxID=1117310 RepID=A0A9N9BCB6_9GLOM|nr:17340_t:CDS:2 [Funneliformis caledonium]